MSEQQSILIFSDAAWAHIQKLLAQADGDHIFRFAVYETGCTGYMYAPSLVRAPQEGDVAMSMPTGEIIYIAPEAIPAIQGTFIDYVSSSLGQMAMTYENPNAEDLCGCGESFNLKPGIEAPGVKRYSGKMHG